MRFAFPIGCWLISLLAYGQTQWFVLEDIVLRGNKKTKDFIILREIELQKGDTIAETQTAEICEKIRNRVFNLNLFIDVEVSFEPSGKQSKVLFVKMKERFFVFAAPILEIGDRNFNEWFYDRNKDFSRLNYGIIFTKRNMRGRNETLELTAQTGFLQRYKFAYKIPYIDKKQIYGLNFYFAYTQFKNLAFQTENNKLTFLRSDENLRERITTNFKIRKRSGFYQWQNLELHFTHSWVNDTILQLNPNYHLEANNRQKYFHFNYEYLFDDRDFVSYPLKGKKLLVRISKYGLLPSDNLNIWTLFSSFQYHKNWNNYLFSSWAVGGRLFFHNGQPYTQAQALGYGNDLVRGYQLYVIDGQHYAWFKTDFKCRLLDFKRDIGFLPTQLRTIPVSVFPKVFFDTGMVRDKVFANESNPLANQLLWGMGAGIDLVTYYNSVFELDFSYNRLREFGIFFNFETSF
ncbi:MAG: POTRA domain-containing protein [Raineya sp.]|nr:POTRA domain-containing protein [Raineya sp.]